MRFLQETAIQLSSHLFKGNACSVKLNIEARSCKHQRSEKSVKCYILGVRVFVAARIQPVMHMHH